MVRMGALVCFSEVLILLGLQGAGFVSVVDTGLTDAHFAEMCEIRNFCVDSIRLTECDVANLGSADSKGVTGGLSIV
jgi:hypothetical protein